MVMTNFIFFLSCYASTVGMTEDESSDVIGGMIMNIQKLLSWDALDEQS